MDIIHGYLLAGLLLVGVPIVLHLIMRQKPKQLSFPAFRFLRQKARINQRKIRLQHLLLLALRMLLIAALCIGLARPRLAADRVPFGGEQAVAAVLVFDTSASMEYTVGDRTRLDEAKQRAREVLDDLALGSQVALLDTGDDPSDETDDDWLNPAQVRTRIDGLRIRAANAPLNRQIERARRLLLTTGSGEHAPPRFLFVFSDRTRESWDRAAAMKLQPTGDINSLFIDVGVDAPKDLAIDKVEIEPPVVAPGGKVKISVTVRATGGDHANELSCQLDPEPDGDRRPDKLPIANLRAGEAEILTFERTAPAKPEGVKEAAFQVVVKLAAADALPGNNVRHATFLVRDKRKVLTLVNADPSEARVWRAALNAAGTFHCDVKTLADAEKLDARDFQAYHVICLYQTPKPAPALWERLANYVMRGGGLAIIPGGEEMLPALDDFNREGIAAKLLPAKLRGLVKVASDERGTPWAGFSGQHPLTKPFHTWSRTTNSDFDNPETQPLANAYWNLELVERETIPIASYANDEKHPALVERPHGKGSVVLFTTPLTPAEPLAKNRPWHNYWSDSSFGLVLVDLTCRYLGGEATLLELNYLCGQPVTVSLPPPPFTPPFALQGPGLTPSESGIPNPDNAATLAITQALGPGNFTVVDGKARPFAGFSFNLRPEESNLERVPLEDIEAAFGANTVLLPERKLSLGEMLKSRWSPPVDLMPWLMMFLLLVLCVESLFANYFYRRQAPSPVGPQPEGAAP